jgi:hypothetical protein
MPGGFALLLFFGVLALIVVGAFYSERQRQKRLSELSLLALQQGWQFDPSNDRSIADRFHHFSMFSRGQDRFGYNTLRGNVDIREQAWCVQLGDFHYETTTTSTDSKGRTSTSTHHHRFSYIVFETPYLGAPPLFIRREGFFDKITGFLGFDDIDFESAQFSKRFYVKSKDKKFAYDIVHPRMMEFLLDADPPTIEFQRGQCCLSRGEKCWSGDEFTATLAWAKEFFALWPTHVTSVLDDIEPAAQPRQANG